jgi:phosphoglucomutase
VHVLTKDFAVAMQAVADLSVTTAIEVDVDSDGIALHFETSAATYRIVMPTCTVDGVRSTWHFSHYEPQPFVVDAFEDYYDPKDDVGIEIPGKDADGFMDSDRALGL